MLFFTLLSLDQKDRKWKYRWVYVQNRLIVIENYFINSLLPDNVKHASQDLVSYISTAEKKRYLIFKEISYFICDRVGSYWVCTVELANCKGCLQYFQIIHKYVPGTLYFFYPWRWNLKKRVINDRCWSNLKYIW